MIYILTPDQLQFFILVFGHNAYLLLILMDLCNNVMYITFSFILRIFKSIYMNH